MLYLFDTAFSSSALMKTFCWLLGCSNLGYLAFQLKCVRRNATIYTFRSHVEMFNSISPAFALTAQCRVLEISSGLRKTCHFIWTYNVSFTLSKYSNYLHRFCLNKPNSILGSYSSENYQSVLSFFYLFWLQTGANPSNILS